MSETSDNKAESVELGVVTTQPGATEDGGNLTKGELRVENDENRIINGSSLKTGHVLWSKGSSDTEDNEDVGREEISKVNDEDESVIREKEIQELEESLEKLRLERLKRSEELGQVRSSPLTKFYCLLRPLWTRHQHPQPCLPPNRLKLEVSSRMRFGSFSGRCSSSRGETQCSQEVVPFFRIIAIPYGFLPDLLTL